MPDEWSELYGVKKYNLNNSDLFWTVSAILVELFRITIGSLLVIFVPQDCHGETCSNQENFEDLSRINELAIVMNFITLAVLLSMYLIIYRREKFLIYHLDENPKLPKTHCSEVFKDNAEIEAGVYWFNRAMFWSGILSALVYTFNMLISGVVIFRDHYDGYESVVQYLVNTGLCTYFIYRAILHSRSSLVLSNVSFLPIAYNQLDETYARNKANIAISLA